MATQYGRTARSSAFQWFVHRITGTFLVFLLITHFWVQHYDRVTASISHSVVTAEEAEAGILPRYADEAAAAVEALRPAVPRPPSTTPASSRRRTSSAPRTGSARSRGTPRARPTRRARTPARRPTRS